MEGPTDDTLAAAVAAGDQAAFQQLLDRHLPAIYGYLAQLCGNPADAEDLSQETFLRLWRRARTYRAGRVQFSTWLHRIAHNLFIDSVRRQRGRRQSLDDDLPASGSLEPDRQMNELQEQSLLREALQHLPERQRSAIVLCHLQGCSVAEAADITGLSVRGLESLLARGRRRLRALLSTDREFDHDP